MREGWEQFAEGQRRMGAVCWRPAQWHEQWAEPACSLLSCCLGAPPNLLCVARLRWKASLQAWVLIRTWWAPGVPAVL